MESPDGLRMPKGHPMNGWPIQGSTPFARSVADRKLAARLAPPPVPIPPPDGAPLTLSREALQLLEAQRGSSHADPVKAATDAGKAFSERLAERDRAARDPGRRIQEAKEKLKLLIQRMQRAAMMGDRRAVAALAREAAALAREVADALKQAPAQTPAEGVPPLISAPEGRPKGENPEALPGASEEGPAPAFTPGGPGPRIQPEALRENPGGFDEGLQRELSQVLGMVRHLLATARSALERKHPASGRTATNQRNEDESERILAQAEEEAAEAARDIAKSLQKNVRTS